MKWPTGKYNGRRIQGCQVSLFLHLLYWQWLPRLRWNFGEPYLIWLCLSVRLKAHYDV